MQPIQYDRFIPNEIHNDPLSTLRSLTKGFDGILKDRLLELNQVASAYISTLIRQMCLLISSKFDKVNYDTHKVDKGITKIQEIMKAHANKQDYFYIYIALTFIMGMNLAIMFLLRIQRHNLVKFILRRQLLPLDTQEEVVPAELPV